LNSDRQGGRRLRRESTEQRPDWPRSGTSGLKCTALMIRGAPSCRDPTSTRPGSGVSAGGGMHSARPYWLRGPSATSSTACNGREPSPVTNLRQLGPHGACDSRRNRCLQKSRTHVKASQPHETDHTGRAFNNDSVARVETVVSSVRRTISSASDVTYPASLKLLNFASRLDRAPSKPACKSATPS